jgi:hypothetical protein
MQLQRKKGRTKQTSSNNIKLPTTKLIISNIQQNSFFKTSTKFIKIIAT